MPCYAHNGDDPTCSRTVVLTTHPATRHRPVRDTLRVVGHDGRVTTVSLAPRPTALRALLVALAAAVLAIAGALPASAHASLVRSSPTSGSTLTAVPPEVALTFNEEINPQFASVTVKSGDTTASTGDLEVDGSTIYQPLDPEMPAGTYTVAYRVTSADGHPVSGTFDFTYDAPGGGEGDGEGTVAPSPTTSGGTGTESPSPTSTTPSETTPTEPATETSSEATTSTTSPESSTTTSSPTTTDGDSTAGSTDEGLPWWVWLLGALAVLGLVGGLVLALARRGDEDVDLESYHRPEDVDGDLR